VNTCRIQLRGGTVARCDRAGRLDSERPIAGFRVIRTDQGMIENRYSLVLIENGGMAMIAGVAFVVVGAG